MEGCLAATAVRMRTRQAAVPNISIEELALKVYSARNGRSVFYLYLKPVHLPAPDYFQRLGFA